MSQRDQKEDNEILFTRNIVCQMIKQAYLDATGKTDGFMRPNTSNNAKKYQECAIYFLKSKAFEQLCDAINVSANEIRRLAFTTQREGRKQRQLDR